MTWEDELMDLLTEKQFKKFEDGEGVFNVPDRKLYEVYEVMK